MKDEWVDVPGASKYSFNVRTHVVLNKKKGKSVKGNAENYKQFCLISDSGSPKTFYVHRIIAELFVPKAEGATTVNHKDFDIHNNDPSNLEWVTYGDNNIHFWQKSDLPRAESAREAKKRQAEEAKAVILRRVLRERRRRLNTLLKKLEAIPAHQQLDTLTYMENYLDKLT